MSERHVCYFWVCTRSMKYMILSVDGVSFDSNWPIFLGNTLEILRGSLRMMLWQKQLLQNAAILGVWANHQGFRHFMAFLLEPAMPTAIGCPAKKSVALSGISAVPKVSSSWCFQSFANPLFWTTPMPIPFKVNLQSAWHSAFHVSNKVPPKSPKSDAVCS